MFGKLNCMAKSVSLYFSVYFLFDIKILKSSNCNDTECEGTNPFETENKIKSDIKIFKGAKTLALLFSFVIFNKSSFKSTYLVCSLNCQVE